jgi:hypothetical protein
LLKRKRFHKNSSNKRKEAGHYSGLNENKRSNLRTITDAAPQTYASLHTRNTAFLHPMTLPE